MLKRLFSREKPVIVGDEQHLAPPISPAVRSARDPSARHTEFAIDRTADLTRNTHRVAVAFGHQNGFNRQAVTGAAEDIGAYRQPIGTARVEVQEPQLGIGSQFFANAAERLEICTSVSDLLV